ncbi:DUF2339 domain-containing protein [Ruegeria hyattellae]|uniref:DUF2339 domain-containing protein n=1 Tax=Ruegeria hyattellae TaxID=3233337 RepID=UPI00355C25CA
MEPVLVLVGLIVVAIPVTIVVLLVGQSRLRRRVDNLERQLTEIEREPTSSDRSDTRSDLARQAAPARRTSEPDKSMRRSAPWAHTRAATKEPSSVSTQKTDRDEGVRPPTPRAVVFRQDRLQALGLWLRENWFYAVSALSLALAGIFLVQYGVENGLLPPTARVAAALVFGTLLIIAGEVVRRRFGDDENSATAYLPSVFSGAGLVTLFGGILAARQMYGLIGPETALGAMVAIALMGVVLGWYHGPLQAAVGLIGAFGAPFLVGGSSEDPSWLYAYFLIATLLGLGIDTVRKWAWVSVLSLFGAYAAAGLVVLSSPSSDAGFVAYLVAIAAAAITIPARSLFPRHDGRMLTEVVRRKAGDPWPEFPTRLAFAAVLTSSAIVSTHWVGSEAMFWLYALLLGGLTIALMTWASGASALQDATIFPAAGLLWLVYHQGFGGVLYRRFAATYSETNEADYPMAVTILAALGAVLSLVAAWRSFRGGRYAAVWAGAAAVLAPAMAIVLEVSWRPPEVIGAYLWALHALMLGALMVLLAERFARVDGEDRMRAALVTLSALSCLAFACIIVLSSAALTVAMAVTVSVAAALDRKFSLPPMSWFIAVGIATLGFRLVVDPGLDWASLAPLPEMLLAYCGTLAGLVLSLWLLRPLARPKARLMLESAAWSTAGILLSLLLLRWLESVGEVGAEDSHWGLGLASVIWLVLAFAQVRRLELGGALKTFRIFLAVVFGCTGAAALLVALSVANPLFEYTTAPVLGPAVFNTLTVAYLIPASVVGFAVWRIGSMPRKLKHVCQVGALALSALWLVLVIRHFWQGAPGMFFGNGVSQPELYTYTMTLLAIGGLLFYQSLARQSDMMRKAGLAVIGLAVAKVFLIDISGLGGLIRVFSLLALGLALAGLAWLNRWALMRKSPTPEPLDQ